MANANLPNNSSHYRSTSNSASSSTSRILAEITPQVAYLEFYYDENNRLVRRGTEEPETIPEEPTAPPTLVLNPVASFGPSPLLAELEANASSRRLPTIVSPADYLPPEADNFEQVAYNALGLPHN